MPIGSVCCDDGSSTFCSIDETCVLDGCCPIGETCMGDGGTQTINPDTPEQTQNAAKDGRLIRPQLYAAMVLGAAGQLL
jgi:hypothetical protein